MTKRTLFDRLRRSSSGKTNHALALSCLALRRLATTSQNESPRYTTHGWNEATRHASLTLILAEVVEPKKPNNTVDTSSLGEVLNLAEEVSKRVRRQTTIDISAHMLDGGVLDETTPLEGQHIKLHPRLGNFTPESTSPPDHMFRQERSKPQ